MPKEGRFYVEYLGWKETRGLYGSEYTDAVIRRLISKRKSLRELHRMTIKITRDELQISQDKSSAGRTQKIRYPAQPMCDVSYVSQCAPPHTDIVGCIFLGYNSHTNCAAHVHAYRFDHADTATTFVKLINSIIEQPDYRERVMAMTKDLIDHERKNTRSSHGAQLTISADNMGSDAGSYGSHSPNSSDSGLPRHYPSAEEALKRRKDIVIKRTPSQRKSDPPKGFQTVQDELNHKLVLQQQKEAPILLPPKDYDTIVRRHGHLSIRARVKQRSVIGDDSFFKAQPPTKAADGNNNRSQTKQRLSGIQQRPERSGSLEQDGDSASNHSSVDEEQSVYGLYRGLKQDDGYNSAHEEMAMWSPEFSFGSQSHSSQSSGFNSSSGSGLRRFKAVSSK